MSRSSAALLGLLFFALTAGAQNRGRNQYGEPRDDPYYRNNGYDRDRGYYGRDQGDPIRRTVSDLNRAASRAYLDDHERHHFDKVAGSLQDFEARLERGKFDTGKLDKAIHNLEHLAQADRVRGDDRETLRRDLFDLRQFRSTRGGYIGTYYPNWR